MITKIKEFVKKEEVKVVAKAIAIGVVAGTITYTCIQAGRHLNENLSTKEE
jgi:hypothetical protein